MKTSWLLTHKQTVHSTSHTRSTDVEKTAQPMPDTSSKAASGRGAADSRCMTPTKPIAGALEGQGRASPSALPTFAERFLPHSLQNTMADELDSAL